MWLILVIDMTKLYEALVLKNKLIEDNKLKNKRYLTAGDNLTINLN